MRLAIVELHDVNPYYKGELLGALELLEEVGCHRFSLLVVPYFWEKVSLGGDGEFLHLLKSTGAEVVLHGYTHRGRRRLQDMLWTDGEGEFGGIDLQETYEKVQVGLELMEYCGFRVNFFVPPAWIGNPYLEDVLYSMNIRGVAYRWHIKDLKDGSIIKSPALTFSNRHFFSWLSLKLLPEMEKFYSRHRVVRLALHMADFRDTRKINLWREIITEIKSSRRLTSYEELFSQSGPSSSFQSLKPAGWMVQ